MSDYKPKNDEKKSISKAVHQKLETYRELIQILHGEKILSYVDMAEKLDVSQDILKSFASGRTKKPRGGFLEKIHEHLPELKGYKLSENATKCIDEIISYEEQLSLPFQVKALGSVMGINAEQFTKATENFNGEYACYRYANKATDIIKTKLTIHPYDTHVGVPRFTLKHFMDDGKEVYTSGFGVPVCEKLVLLGRVVNANSFLSLSIENKIGDNFFSGIFLLSIAEAAGICSRVLLMKLSLEDREQKFGILKYSEIAHEIDGMEQSMDNEITTHEHLRPYKIR